MYDLQTKRLIERYCHCYFTRVNKENLDLIAKPTVTSLLAQDPFQEKYSSNLQASPGKVVENVYPENRLSMMIQAQIFLDQSRWQERAQPLSQQFPRTGARESKIGQFTSLWAKPSI